jgi:dTDP-4-amino-4,6-dideoxygalactose transaminase
MLDAIAERRREVHQFYYAYLKPLDAAGLLRLPHIPENCTSNYHLLYILLPDVRIRNELLDFLKETGIEAVFHYVPLHSSPIGRRFGYKDGDLPVTEDLSRRLLRLPFYYDLTFAQKQGGSKL